MPFKTMKVVLKEIEILIFNDNIYNAIHRLSMKKTQQKVGKKSFYM